MSRSYSKPIVFGRPADESLEAYKTWIRGMTAELGGVDDMSDAEWEQKWREFWSTPAPTEKP